MGGRALLAIVVAAAVPAEAQSGPATQTPTWAGESAVIISNALAGGLTAGIRQALSGGSFGKGFLWGAAGGTVGYLGKRVASTRIDGAGFLGREIAAVGHSMVRNASDGRPVLSRLDLPLGPLPAWVTVAPVRDPVLNVRVDAVSLAVLVALSTDSNLRFDLPRTLSLGAPTFEAVRKHVLGPDNNIVSGLMFSGNIVMSDYRFRQSEEGIEHTMTHEVVHVIQRDFVFVVWSDPLNHALLGAIGLEVVNKVIVFNEVSWLSTAVSDWMTGEDGTSSPLELEAEWLAR